MGVAGNPALKGACLRRTIEPTEDAPMRTFLLDQYLGLQRFSKDLSHSDFRRSCRINILLGEFASNLPQLKCETR